MRRERNAARRVVLCAVLAAAVACARSGFEPLDAAASAARCDRAHRGLTRYEPDRGLLYCDGARWLSVRPDAGQRDRAADDGGEREDSAAPPCQPGTPGPGGITLWCGAGEEQLVVMPAGCHGSVVEPTCTGQDDTIALPWGSAGIERGPEVQSASDGAQNTVNLMVFVARDGPGAHPAASYCADLVLGGYDDWYLPAVEEMAPIVTQGDAVTGLAANSWTSTELSDYTVCMFQWPGGPSCGGGSESRKDRTNAVRCFRRHGVPLPPPTVSLPTPERGYLVLSAGAWGGDLGGLSGASALCLQDLVDHDWLGKADASGRGLLDAAHVRAFLCDGSAEGSCAQALPLVSYRFARAGAPEIGGAGFTADADGVGPGDLSSWAGLNYLGGDVDYWANRGSHDDSHWARDPASCCSFCQGFATASAAHTAIAGNSNAADSGRWYARYLGCDELAHLLCLVQP